MEIDKQKLIKKIDLVANTLNLEENDIKIQ